MLRRLTPLKQVISRILESGRLDLPGTTSTIGSRDKDEGTTPDDSEALSQATSDRARMFKRILVAYDESAKASRALSAAIYLAKAVGAELQAVTVFDASSASIVHAAPSDSPLGLTLIQDRRERYAQLQAEARDRAMRRGVELVTHLVEPEEADSIIQLIAHLKADLLVVGLHRHSQYLSRLWSTVYEGAQNGLCSVLGIQ